MMLLPQSKDDGFVWGLLRLTPLVIDCNIFDDISYSEYQDSNASCLVHPTNGSFLGFLVPKLNEITFIITMAT